MSLNIYNVRQPSQQRGTKDNIWSVNIFDECREMPWCENDLINRVTFVPCRDEWQFYLFSPTKWEKRIRKIVGRNDLQIEAAKNYDLYRDASLLFGACLRSSHKQLENETIRCGFPQTSERENTIESNEWIDCRVKSTPHIIYDHCSISLHSLGGFRCLYIEMFIEQFHGIV